MLEFPEILGQSKHKWFLFEVSQEFQFYLRCGNVVAMHYGLDKSTDVEERMR